MKIKKGRSLQRQMGNTQINSKSPGRWHYIARLALCLQNPSTYHTNDKSGSVLRLLLGIWAEPAQLQAVIMAIAACLDEVWQCPAQDPQFCAVRGSCCASASGQPARWDAGLLNHAKSKIRGMAETPPNNILYLPLTQLQTQLFWSNLHSWITQTHSGTLV